MSAYVGMPPPLNPSVTRTKDFFQALDNFTRVFAIRPGEKVLMLTDPLLDPRVVDAVTGLATLARRRAATVHGDDVAGARSPGPVRPLLEAADFVVSTWFCSIISPFCIGAAGKGPALGEDHLLPRPRSALHAAGALSGRARRRARPRDGIASPAEPDFELALHRRARDRFRDRLHRRNARRSCSPATAGAARCLPTSRAATSTTCRRTGRTSGTARRTATIPMRRCRCAARFIRSGRSDSRVRSPSASRCEFEGDTVVEVRGDSEEARLLREMLVGGRLIELGCGFNPKAPRLTVYPAGSNAPGRAALRHRPRKARASTSGG